MNNAMPTFERSEFRKSTRSGQNPQACVEVARGGGWVALRDSKQEWNSTDDHRLVFTADQFDAWLAALGSGSTDAGCIDISQRADGVNALCSTVPQAHDNELTFDDAEIAAFLDGARNGEFRPCRGRRRLTVPQGTIPGRDTSMAVAFEHKVLKYELRWKGFDYAQIERDLDDRARPTQERSAIGEGPRSAERRRKATALW